MRARGDSADNVAVRLVQVGVFACAVVSLAVLAPARAARAQGPSLAWDAPAGCPTRAALLDAIRVRLDEAAWTSTAPELVANVRIGALPGGYALTLETQARAEPAGKRYIEAASCAELIEAAALIIALAIDPKAAERAPSSEQLQSASPFALPLGDQAPVVAPRSVDGSAAELAPAPPPPPPPPARAEPVEKKPAQPPAAKKPAQPPAAKKPPPRPRVVAARLGEKPPAPAAAPEPAYQRLFFVRPLARFDLGTLPRLAFGPTLQLGVRLARATLELDAGFLPEQTLRVSGRSAGAGGVYWFGASAGGCYRLEAGRFELAPCARVEYGRLQATGQAAASTGSGADAAPWLAVRFGARASYALFEALALVVDLELGVLMLAATFSSEELGELHSTPPVVGRFGVGLELRL